MATAEVLDIHHATVLRKIKGLEKSLGATLFHRHSRGHTPTEEAHAIREKLCDMEITVSQIHQIAQESKDLIQGKLIITTAPGMMGAIRPIVTAFIKENPTVDINLILSNEKLKLENNEAHISIRPGRPPEELDYIANNLGKIHYGLFATKSYLKGKQESSYQYIRTSKELSHIPIINWMCTNIDNDKILYTTNLFSDIASSVIGGFGVGPMLTHEASQYSFLKQTHQSLKSWDNNLFMVFHKNLRKNRKLQAFKDFFIEHF